MQYHQKQKCAGMLSTSETTSVLLLDEGVPSVTSVVETNNVSEKHSSGSRFDDDGECRERMARPNPKVYTLLSRTLSYPGIVICDEPEGPRSLNRLVRRQFWYSGFSSKFESSRDNRLWHQHVQEGDSFGWKPPPYPNFRMASRCLEFLRNTFIKNVILVTNALFFCGFKSRAKAIQTQKVCSRLDVFSMHCSTNTGSVCTTQH